MIHLAAKCRPTIRKMALDRLKSLVKQSPVLHAYGTHLREVLFGRTEFEECIVPLLCHSDKVAIDVGAHTGSYTRHMLKKSRLVIAVEPNPRLAAMLRVRFSRFAKDGRAMVEQCALSDRDGGEIDLFVPPEPGLATVESSLHAKAGIASEVFRVPRRTLDGFAHCGEVALIKIDVEGHEGSVLSGGLRLIDQYHPTLLVEAEERHKPGALAAVVSSLTPLGYRGFYFLNGHLNSLEGFDPNVLQDCSSLLSSGRKVQRGRTYVNNFLFLPGQGRSLARLARFCGQSTFA